MFGKVLKHLKHTWCPRKPVSGNSILLLGYSYRLQLLVQLETHLYSNSAAPRRRPSSQIGALIGWPGLDHDQVSLVYESMSLSVYEPTMGSQSPVPNMDWHGLWVMGLEDYTWMRSTGLPIQPEEQSTWKLLPASMRAMPCKRSRCFAPMLCDTLAVEMSKQNQSIW